MTVGVYAAIVGTVLAIAGGQLLFKHGANLMRDANSYLDVTALAVLGSAIVLYVATTVAWIWALQFVPLSRAYPFMSLAFVIVPLASYFLFGERINATYAFGVLLIVGGVVVIGFSLARG